MQEDNNNLPVPREQSAPLAPYTDVGYAPSDSIAEANGGGLLEYWNILKRRKGTVIIIAAVGAVVGFLVTIPQQQVYQSRTTLEILSMNDTFLNQKQINPMSETGVSADQTDIQTQIRILQSESLLESVTTKLKAETTASDKEERPAFWRKMLNLPEPESSSERQRAIGYAVGNMKIRNVPQTRIIELTVDSTDPKIAADFANTLTNEYIEQHLESHFKTTERTQTWLGGQLDDMRIKLERSADALQQYASRNGLLFSSDEKTSVSEDKLRQLQTGLTAAQADRIGKQSRWEMASASPPEALPDILNDATLQGYQAKLTELSREMAELRATYTAENAKVKRIQAQIEPIQAAADKARADILKRIKNEYDEAERREKLLADDYAAQRGLVSGEGEKSIQYNILKREVDSNRALYDSMLQQMKAASLASALQASNIRVVDPGKQPKRPYKPSIPNSSGLGLLTGCFLGIALVVMQERANRTIQEPGETAYYTNLPELGVVPSNEMGLKLWYSYGERKSSKPAPETATNSSLLPIESDLGTAQPGGPSVRNNVELATWHRKPSMVAESFRATLVSILFSGSNGSRPRVMVVTSCSPGDGKSTVVSNLGIAVAEVNQRVLLIDADMRKPRLHQIFGLPNDRGLSNLLRSKEPAAEDLTTLIQPSGIPDLYILTCGPTTSAATSLLYSNRMQEALKILKAQFETIFLDTPPMLHIPDARVLGKIVDRVIVVVRSGKTTRDAALAARQRFGEDRTNVLGTILNDWNPKRSPNGYYGYNGGYYGAYKGYGYGKSSEKDEVA